MPPMPPGGMPPPDGAFGFLAIMASVVISNDATEAASVKATRTTLVGSMMQAATPVGANTVITISALDMITLTGAKTLLVADDFTFE
jgi:hypothetical protein